MAGLAIYSIQIVIRWLLDQWAIARKDVDATLSRAEHIFPPYQHEADFLEQLWKGKTGAKHGSS